MKKRWIYITKATIVPTSSASLVTILAPKNIAMAIDRELRKLAGGITAAVRRLATNPDL